MSYIIKKCPHCKQMVMLPKEEFNCKIYRHGIYKINLQQIIYNSMELGPMYIGL